MSRKLMRVSLDFDWPMSKRWEGYVNPHMPHECSFCSGSGESPIMRQANDFWSFGLHHQVFGYPRGPLVENLTQELVNLLVDNGRLWDFSSEWIDHKWVRLTNDNGTPYYPRASIVNATAREKHVHDAINRGIVCTHLVQQMSEESLCAFCNGTGDAWDSEEHKAAYDNWKETEPPKGDGWQVWETVSEGSPVTPVFATPDALIEHLTTKGEHSTIKRGKPPYSREAAEAFVKSGWSASGVIVNGEIYESIESAKFQKDAD